MWSANSIVTSASTCRWRFPLLSCEQGVFTKHRFSLQYVSDRNTAMPVPLKVGMFQLCELRSSCVAADLRNTTVTHHYRIREVRRTYLQSESPWPRSCTVRRDWATEVRRPREGKPVDAKTSTKTAEFVQAQCSPIGYRFAPRILEAPRPCWR